MNKDDLFKALIAAMLAFVVWSMLSRAFLPPPPPPATPPGVATAEQATSPAPSAPENMKALGADSERFIELGNVYDDPTSGYAMTAKFTNRGASMVSARLTDHAAEVGQPQRYEILGPVKPEGRPALYSFATKSINLNQNPNNFELDNLYWHSKQENFGGGQRVIFWLEFVRQGEDQPFARLTKTYTLSEQPQGNGHNDLKMALKFENLTDAPIQLIITQLGPVGVPQQDPRIDYRKIIAGVDDGTQITLVAHGNSSLEPGDSRDLLNGEESLHRLVWAALGNKFFAVIVAPQQAEGGPNWITDAKAVRLAGIEHEKDDATFQLVTAPLTIPPAGSMVKSFDCYLGPKSKKLFTSDPAYAARQYVQLVEEDYYFCAWAPIVDVMLWLLNASYVVIPNYGIAIIIMVLIVRTLLHPLTKKGQVNMTRMAGQMAVLQPKMEEIRKKYANDKTRQNQEIMKLYQQEGVNPAGQMLTCLPMMCQMPIWGGLWAALNFTVEMRHQPFCLWIKDLTAPDAFFEWNTPLLLIGTTFNLLPVLLGISMWLQQRLMPKPAAATKQAGKTTDQLAQQRMMMYFMSVFMVFIFYNAPSGLTLYIMASNFFGLLEQYLIRKHIKEQEEADKLRRPIAGRKGQHLAQARKFKKPRFLEKLEKMAEEAKRK